MYNEWTQGVEEVAKVNLEKPLLLRDPRTSLISVNFDPRLVALLREVKYLEQREGTEHEIPRSAADVFSQHEMYRKFLQVSDRNEVVYKIRTVTVIFAVKAILGGILVRVCTQEVLCAYSHMERDMYAYFYCETDVLTPCSIYLSAHRIWT